LHEAILIKTSREAMSKRPCCIPHQRVRKLASSKGLCKFPGVMLNPPSIGCVTGYQPNPCVVQVTEGFAPKITKRGLKDALTVAAARIPLPFPFHTTGPTHVASSYYSDPDVRAARCGSLQRTEPGSGTVQQRRGPSYPFLSF
jgi:hypothetical protein